MSDEKPNTTTEKTSEKGEKSSFFKDLTGVGQRFNWRARKKAGQAPAVSGSQGTIWVLESGRPVPVAVDILATDGALTAVKAPALSADREIIVNAIANPS